MNQESKIKECTIYDDNVVVPFNINNIRNDVQSYMDYMQNSIKQNWQPPQNIHNKTVVVEYTILKSGKITDIKVTQSSNNKALDESAIQAVSNAKLPALPDEIEHDSIKTTFTFERK